MSANDPKRTSYAYLKTAIAHTIQIISGHQRGAPNKYSHPINRNALPIKDKNNRSPRVVSIAKTPRRGLPPGLQYSHTAIEPIHETINRKNAAVALVHAIHEPSGWVHQSALKIITSCMLPP